MDDSELNARQAVEVTTLLYGGLMRLDAETIAEFMVASGESVEEFISVGLKDIPEDTFGEIVSEDIAEKFWNMAMYHEFFNQAASNELCQATTEQDLFMVAKSIFMNAVVWAYITGLNTSKETTADAFDDAISDLDLDD